MELLVKLGLSQASLNATLGKMGQTISNSLSNRLGGLLSVASLGIAIRKTTEYADTIEEASTRIGVGTKRLQEWLYAAKQNGVEIERLTSFIERLTDAAQDQEKVKLFRRMGINPQGMTPEQLFGAVNTFARGRSQTDIMAALGGIVDVRRLGPMMNLLQADLDGLGQQAQKVGAVMEQETLHRLAILNDQFSILSQILVTQFGPALLKAAEIALVAFGGLKGGAGWAGAMTAGLDLSPKAIAARTISPLIGIRDIYRAFTDPNRASFAATADNIFGEDIDAMRKLAARFGAGYVPPLPPTIGAAAEEAKKQRDSKGSSPFAFSADQLAQAGLFTGSALLMNPNLTVAREQLDVLRKIEANTANSKSPFA